MTYPVPAGTIKIGPDDKPTTFSLGWRVQPGRIQCYLNDKLVIDCTNVPADLGTIRKSPILLINKSCYIEFDNFVVQPLITTLSMSLTLWHLLVRAITAEISSPATPLKSLRNMKRTTKAKPLSSPRSLPIPMQTIRAQTTAAPTPEI